MVRSQQTLLTCYRAKLRGERSKKYDGISRQRLKLPNFDLKTPVKENHVKEEKNRVKTMK